MELRLSPEEAELVREILADRHSELFRDISRAQHHHFKTALRQKEVLLDAVVHRLDALLEEGCAASVSDPTLG
jgi:hypothetical protein